MPWGAREPTMPVHERGPDFTLLLLGLLAAGLGLALWLTR